MVEELIFLFLFYAIIGWLWETPFVSIKEKKYINRGFLRGPYIPIYGFSCISIIIVLKALEFQKSDTVLMIVLQILIISLISAIWEFGTSWVLEKLFKQRWWDYSYKKYNLQGRVSLDYAILFGLGGFLLWRFVNPLLNTLYGNLQGPLLDYTLAFFTLLFLIDSTLTVIDLVKVKQFITKFTELKDNLSQDYQQLMADILSEFQASKDTIKQKIEQLKTKISTENKKTKSFVIEKISDLEKLVNFSRITKRIYAKFPRLSAIKTKKEAKKIHENNN